MAWRSFDSHSDLQLLLDLTQGLELTPPSERSPCEKRPFWQHALRSILSPMFPSMLITRPINQRIEAALGDAESLLEVDWPSSEQTQESWRMRRLDHLPSSPWSACALKVTQQLRPLSQNVLEVDRQIRFLAVVRPLSASALTDPSNWRMPDVTMSQTMLLVIERND